MAITIPTLPHGCKSFMVIETKTGDCVMEIYADDKRIPFLREDTFHLVTALAHLVMLNTGG